MRRITGIVLAASALVMLSGCHRFGHHHGWAADPAAIEKQIKADESQWVKDFASRDAAVLAGHYSADAAFAIAGSPLAEGTAVRRVIEQMVTDPNLNVTFESDRVQIAKSGELAYSRGHFTLQSTDPATKKPRAETGSYLTVWQKQANGSWKAVEDFVVPGAPAATAPK